MANTINLASVYDEALLDEVYKSASVTNAIQTPAEVIRVSEDSKTIYYPQVSTGGLGDYSRTSGYKEAAVNVVWKQTAPNYDRGAKITVDAMDNQESRNLAFGRAAATLIREHEVPEGDAFTFATICGKSGIQSADADLSGASDLLTALYDATVSMDENEVPAAGRILYITPTLHKSVQMLDTTKSREILGNFANIVDVPQARFYTSITLDADNDWKPTTGGYKINFLVLDPGAILKWDKHVVSSVIPAALNPDADADIVKYRKYALVDVFDNKVNGVYLHRQSTALS